MLFCIAAMFNLLNDYQFFLFNCFIILNKFINIYALTYY